MKRRSIRKKECWDDGGVSEVIGTILILAITVVLFSVIIIWVGSFPAPEASVRLTMRGELEPIVNAGIWGGARIYITHERGEALQGFMTNVIIAVTQQGGGYGDNRLELQGTQAGMPYGLANDDTWNTGETWSYTNFSIAASDRVEVFIIDTEAGQVMWSAHLLGREASHFPIFTEKWTDAWPQTIYTRDIVEDDDLTFAVYARIEDNDGDLDPAKVRLLLTWLEIETRLFDNGLHGDRVANDGIFSYDFDNYFTDTGFQFPGIELTWDGGILLFNATDDMNHTTQSRMNLIVVLSEATKQEINLQQNLTLPPGGPGNLSFGNRLQRFDIFNFTDWQTLRWQSNSTRQFVKGEIAVVLVASKTLEANDEENTFMLYDSAGVPQVFCGVTPGPKTVPSSTDAFIFLDAVGKWTVFMYMFNTSSEAIGCGDGKLDYGRYPVEVTIRDTYGNRFHTVDRINVTDEDGNIPDYPDMLIYCDSSHLISCKEFNFTDTVYVKIIVNTAQTDMAGVDIGDVIIEDYVGGKQVWAPPGIIPVSDAEYNNTVTYKFTIDLSKPNVDPWLQGDNYYGFWVRSLVDDDEEYILALSMQIKVNGPRWALDIVTANEDFQHPTHETKFYAFFYDNVAPLFNRYPIEQYQAGPSGRDPPWGSGGPFLSIAYSDIDLDQDLDVVVGIEEGHVFWYRNIGGDGEFWLRYEIDFLDSPVNGIDAGDIDDDRDSDIVAGADNGQIWWYKNGAAWSPTLVDNVGTAINEIKLADVVGTDLLDIVVACDDSKIRIYENINGTFGSTTANGYQTLSETINIGTIDAGAHGVTHTSDDTYEVLKEGTGDAYTITMYNATDEFVPEVGSRTGTYTDTHADDGVYEVLTEGVTGTGVNTKYTYRNGSLSADTAHFFPMGDVSMVGGDEVVLKITGFLSPDSGASTEAFAIGFYDTGFTWPGWTFTATTETSLELDLAGAGFTGGTISILIRDTDTSKNPPDKVTDTAQTSFKIDQMYVQVRHVDGNTSRLDHVWKFDKPAGGGDAYKFYVEAYRPTNSEGDDFRFQYALSDAGPWSDLITVTKAVDDDKTQSATLPTSVGGVDVFVRVIDTDATKDNLNLDKVYVDYMRIDRIVVVPEITEINVGGAVNSVAVGDMDEDGVNDIVCGFSSNPYARVYYGPSWTASDPLTATDGVNAVDIGYFDGDDYLDVAVGTSDKKVHIFINGQARGAWTRSQIATSAGSIISIRAGDVDGDYWDDIVFGTDASEIVWLRHTKGQFWESHSVDPDPDLSTKYYDIDLGDADRGILLDPVREE